MSVPSWYLDELAHAGPEHLDAAYIAGYDRKGGYDPSHDVERLRALGLDSTASLVDLGCGTGAVALAVAPFCRQVIAVDVSPLMLAALAARVRQSGIDNLTLVKAGFLSYLHQDEPADFVVSRHALHHLPDFWKALALSRVTGILRPGGVFYLRDLIYAFDPGDAEPTIENWLAHAARRPADGWTRSELETHLREEHSTFTWLLEPMLERAGLKIQEREYSSSQTYATYVCVKA